MSDSLVTLSPIVFYFVYGNFILVDVEFFCRKFTSFIFKVHDLGIFLTKYLFTPRVCIFLYFLGLVIAVSQ